jgi:CHAT domain-containing protein
MELGKRAARRGDDPAALHTLAVLDLVAAEDRARALDRSITSLRRLANVSDRPAPVLADLAAALVVRAERTQAPRDLLEAYGVAAEALQREPRNLAALYNAALALDRFGLVDETARAWRAYLAADPRSAWADDARRRIRRLEQAATRPTPPPADAPVSAYEAYGRADAQGARELGMDRLLARWAEAMEAGDSRGAEHHLVRAGALGTALVARPGGDASLADAVHAIRAAQGNQRTLRAIARAHRDYAGARRDFESMRYAEAARLFTAVDATPQATPALRGWARVYLANARLLGAGGEAEPILVELASAESGRFPALAGRARWMLGRTQGQGESWDRGLEQARTSAALFSQAGERENEGAALTIAAEILFVVGEADSAYATMHRAMYRLRSHRTSVRLHNLLLATAREAASDGLLRSAIVLQNEGVSVSLRSGHPLYAAEARLARARLLASAGVDGSARADVAEARPLVSAIQHELARTWMQSDLRRAEAVSILRNDPHRATQVLDSAAEFWGSQGVAFLTLPALVGSAEARLAANDVRGARTRFEAAVRLLEQRRASIRMERRRAAVFDRARDVVDRLVMLQLGDNRVPEALDYMDRSRASLAPTGPLARADASQLRGLDGETALEYALVADTLLIWTVSGRGVTISRTLLDTVRFTRTLEELETKLERHAPETEVRPALSLLYDWLIRPVERELGSGETPLVVIADGQIAAVPFSALVDSRRGRYLVEAHPLRFAASLREARRRPTAAPAPGVLLVADPAFSSREHPLLARLAHAPAEVRTIAQRYSGATVVEGSAATHAAFESGLARSGIVHFAGHAVFDDERPERSHLVLAPLAGREGAGRITAAHLAEMDLRHVRLVVLAACRTVRGGKRRAGGFTGLAGAFLAAGAGGAVGSLWDVDDRSAAAVMSEFHRIYARGRDGPRALRTAQLASLRSRDAALRTPAAWGAFRYAGT